jgi:hypothetical protein
MVGMVEMMEYLTIMAGSVGAAGWDHSESGGFISTAIYLYGYPAVIVIPSRDEVCSYLRSKKTRFGFQVFNNKYKVPRRPRDDTE